MSRHATDTGQAPRDHQEHVHRDAGPGPLLARLSFLLGDFEGVGRLADDRGTYRKRLSGRPEAGGRFLSLRMGAEYPLPGNRVDHHSALVIVGEALDGGSVVARAYTDGGAMHDYVVEFHDGRFVFADVLPDHGEYWRRARKILVPTAEGFDERLEVALEEGGFAPFSSISMRRVAPGTSQDNP